MARSSYLLRLLRRLDCVAAKTKQKLNPDPFLLRDSGQSFYNTSPMDMGKLMGNHDHIRENLFAYVQPFSPATRDIFERFDFATQTSLTEFRNNQDDNFMVALFADLWLRQYAAFRHAIDSTQQK